MIRDTDNIREYLYILYNMEEKLISGELSDYEFEERAKQLKEDF